MLPQSPATYHYHHPLGTYQHLNPPPLHITPPKTPSRHPPTQNNLNEPPTFRPEQRKPSSLNQSRGDSTNSSSLKSTITSQNGKIGSVFYLSTLPGISHLRGGHDRQTDMYLGTSNPNCILITLSRSKLL